MVGKIFIPIRHESLRRTGQPCNVYGAVLAGEDISILPEITLSLENLAGYYHDRITPEWSLSYTPPIDIFSQKKEGKTSHYRVYPLSAAEISSFEKILTRLSSKPVLVDSERG